MLTQTIPFTTPSNYTLSNSEFIEVDGGSLKLISKLIASEQIKAVLTGGIDLDRSRDGGTLIGSAVGGAAVADGYLNLKGNTLKYVDYNIDTYSPASSNIGAIRMKFVPNWSGAPAAQRSIFTFGNAANQQNEITLKMDISGNLIYQVRSQTGSTVENKIVSYSFVAGTEYEIYFHWDITSGDTRLFIDGLELGTTTVSTNTRASSFAGYFIRLGSDRTATDTSDFEIKDFQMFDTKQHVANFAGEVPREIIATEFSTVAPSALVNASSNMTSIESFAETMAVAKPAGTEVKYTFRYNGSDFYVQAGALVASNGTYAQSSTAAEIIAAIGSGSLDVDPDAAVQLRVFLYSDGTNNVQLDEVTIGYNLFVNQIDLTRCICYGYLLDNKNVPTKKVVTIKSNSPFHINDNTVSVNEKLSDENGDFSETGYYSVELPETTSISVQLLVTEQWVDSQGKTQVFSYNVLVPASSSSSFEDMKV